MKAPNKAASATMLLNQAMFVESFSIAAPTAEPKAASAIIELMAIAGYPIAAPIARAAMKTAPAAGYINRSCVQDPSSSKAGLRRQSSSSSIDTFDICAFIV